MAFLHRLFVTVAVIAASNLVAGMKTSPPVTREGLPVRDELGLPISYGPDRLHKEGPPSLRPVVAAAGGLPDENAAMAASTTSNTKALWSYAMFGVGIGNSNIVAVDNDGTTEVVLGGSVSGAYGGNNFWHAVTWNPATLRFDERFTSTRYASGIVRIDAGDLNNDGRQEIIVATADGRVSLHDIRTKEVVDSFTIGTNAYSVCPAKLRHDGIQSLIACESGRVSVYTSGTLEWSMAVTGASDVAVGQMDTDASMEIAVNSGYVIDVDTRTIQWNRGSSFGYMVEACDVDDDGAMELVGVSSWYTVMVYDVQTQLPLWDIATDLDNDALCVADVNDDGRDEILLGDGQWGDVYAVDTYSRSVIWKIHNPEHGVTNIGVADVDGDGTKDILWGAGYSSSGADYLFKGDWRTRTARQACLHLDGPFVGPEIGDLDGDGRDEIVVCSTGSDSGYGSGLILVFDKETLSLRGISGETAGGVGWGGLRDLCLRDVDGNGRPEILIATSSAYSGLVEVYSFSPNNTFARLWYNNPMPSGAFSHVSAGDIDNDGRCEIVAAGNRVYVYTYGTTGELWHSVPLTAKDLVVGDFDNDPALEIVALDSYNTAIVLDGSTNVIEATFGAGFTSVQTLGRRLAFAVTNGSVDQYEHNGSQYVRVSQAPVASGAMDGFTIENESPLTLWIGIGGVAKAFANGALLSQSADYGAPFGARVRSNVTAGLYTITGFRPAAPVIVAEPAETPGTTNSISWRPPTGTDQYQLQADTSLQFDSPQISSGWISASAYECGPLLGGMTYHYRVKARDSASGAESGWSYPVSSKQQAHPLVTGMFGPSPATNAAFTLTIAWATAVTGFDLDDLLVTNGSATNLRWSAPGGNALVDIVPAAQGSVTVTLPEGACEDPVGNLNSAASFSVLYDSVSPTCVVTGPASPLDTSPIPFTIAFSESVEGLSMDDISVSNGVKQTLTGTGAGPYTLHVAPEAQGPVICQVTAGAAHDAAGNPSTVSIPVEVHYDSFGPIVNSMVRDLPSPTVAAVVSYTVTFSENVSGLKLDNFSVETTGVVGASLVSLSSISSNVYQVVVSTGIGDGSLVVNVDRNLESIQDVLGHSMAEAYVGADVYTIHPRVDLAVTMTHSADVVNVGQNVAWLVRAANHGASAATAVMVEEVLPDGVELVSVETSQGSVGETTAHGVIVNLGTLGPSSEAVITLTVRVVAAGELTNTVTANCTEHDVDYDNNTVVDRLGSTTLADLFVTATASPDPVIAGANLTHTIVVENGGPSPATSVTLHVTLGADLEIVSVATSHGEATTSGTNSMTMAVGRLDADTSVSATIIAATSVPGTALLTASVSAADEDPDLSDNATLADTPVVPYVPATDLAVSTTVMPAEPSLAQNVSLAVQMRNDGPDTASGTILSNELPDGMLFVSSSAPEAATVIRSGVVYTDVGVLPKDAVASLTLVLMPTTPGTHITTAVVTADQTDPDLVDNMSTEEILVSVGSGPDLVGAWVSFVVVCSTDESATSYELKTALLVSNKGDRRSAAAWINYYLSDDAILTFDDVPLGRTRVGALRPGRSLRKNFSARLAPNTGIWGKHVIAVLDARSNVPESNEFNNNVIHELNP